jgi:hypothetical protein
MLHKFKERSTNYELQCAFLAKINIVRNQKISRIKYSSLCIRLQYFVKFIMIKDVNADALPSLSGRGILKINQQYPKPDAENLYVKSKNKS